MYIICIKKSAHLDAKHVLMNRFISFYLFKRGLPTANFKICSHHDIAEILLMLVLNTNQPTANHNN
jgi:hypothetical protein